MKHHHTHARRPSIGITVDSSEVSPAAPFLKYEVRAAYAEAVSRAGGLPFMLPYTEDRQLFEQYADRLSGILVTGGAFDVPPEMYGEAPQPKLGALKPERSHFELSLIRVAIQRKLPILGICGGMQLLNVAYGGTLIQDIGSELPMSKSHEQTHDRTQPAHPIEVRDKTILAECMGGRGQAMVNSTHHQAIKKLGAGLLVSATSPDGVVESIELPNHEHFVLGVQWHPELMIDTVPPHLGIYKTFIHRARERRH